jgi:glycolate oxidase FAD binding subunit
MSQSAQASLSRLEEIVGSAHVARGTAEISAREIDGARPSVVVRPADASQIAEILRYAAAEKLAIIPTGSGTKLGIGSPPARYDISLDLSRMNRVLAYDPQDLTLGVEPGVRIETLLSTLAEEKQFLPLAVPFSERATIGGIVAANSSSPLRHAYGGVRDFCLGMEFVTGEGIQAKSGGRVVKNVTGYDLHKLLIGSLGTLAVITRVNFRTFPLLPAQETFVASFSAATAAFDFCQAISHSALTPQIVEVADPGAERLLFSGNVSTHIEPRTWSVILSVAGQPTVVERHARELGHLATAANAEEFLPLAESEANSLLRGIREFPKLILEAAPGAAILRIGIAPTMMATLIGKLRDAASRNKQELLALARASGILYAALLPGENSSDASAFLTTAITEAFRACAQIDIPASAMLESCPTNVKTAAGGVWGPSRQDFELAKRVKKAFDPQNVLAPGRFAGGL